MGEPWQPVARGGAHIGAEGPSRRAGMPRAARCELAAGCSGPPPADEVTPPGKKGHGSARAKVLMEPTLMVVLMWPKGKLGEGGRGRGEEGEG